MCRPWPWACLPLPNHLSCIQLARSGKAAPSRSVNRRVARQRGQPRLTSALRIPQLGSLKFFICHGLCIRTVIGEDNWHLLRAQSHRQGSVPRTSAPPGTASPLSALYLSYSRLVHSTPLSPPSPLYPLLLPRLPPFPFLSPSTSLKLFLRHPALSCSPRVSAPPTRPLHLLSPLSPPFTSCRVQPLPHCVLKEWLGIYGGVGPSRASQVNLRL